jgi:hypothetical protein
MPPVDQRKKDRPSGQHALHHGLPEKTSHLRRPALEAMPDRVGVPGSLHPPEVKVVLVHSRPRTLSQNDLSRMNMGKQTSDYALTCGDQAMKIKISSMKQEFSESTIDRSIFSGVKCNEKRYNLLRKTSFSIVIVLYTD